MNRELLKSVGVFVLDLALELECQRRQPRSKCIEFGNLDFTFDDEGECVVRHMDGRLGEINIDPDEIQVNVSYRHKEMTIRTESDKHLTSRDIMDIIGDFIDYDQEEDFIPTSSRGSHQTPAPKEPHLRKWLLSAFLAHLFETRPESERGLDYSEWCSKVGAIPRPYFTDIHEETEFDISEMAFVNTIGQFGYVPQESMDANLYTVVNALSTYGKLPPRVVPLVQHLRPNE